MPRLGVVTTRWGLSSDTLHSHFNSEPGAPSVIHRWSRSHRVRLSDWFVVQGKEGEGSGQIIDLCVYTCQCAHQSETLSLGFVDFLSRLLSLTGCDIHSRPFFVIWKGFVNMCSACVRLFYRRGGWLISMLCLQRADSGANCSGKCCGTVCWGNCFEIAETQTFLLPSCTQTNMEAVTRTEQTFHLHCIIFRECIKQ